MHKIIEIIRAFPWTCGWFVGYFAIELVIVAMGSYCFLSLQFAFKLAVGVFIAAMFAVFEIKRNTRKTSVPVRGVSGDD